MKGFFAGLPAALSMFSVLPMPRRLAWTEAGRRYILAWLPLTGLLAGLVQGFWFWLCGWLGLGEILFAAGLTLLPLLLSGGIHMDGFCDTADALASHGPPEKKREILKDPHSGAFALIFAGVWLLGFFALCTELPRSWAGLGLLGLQQVLSRVLGALCSLLFPAAAPGGLQYGFRKAAARPSLVLLLVWAALCAGGLVLLAPAGGGAALAVGLICLPCVGRMAKKQFGGMSGDLAGFAICLSQLLMLLAYILTERVLVLCC